MRTVVYLTRRRLKGGRRGHYMLRWKNPDEHWHAESTGVSDKLQARFLQRQKQDELLGLKPPPEPPKPTVG